MVLLPVSTRDSNPTCTVLRARVFGSVGMGLSIGHTEKPNRVLGWAPPLLTRSTLVHMRPQLNLESATRRLALFAPRGFQLSVNNQCRTLRYL